MISNTSITRGPPAKPIPVPSKRGFKSNLPQCARRTKLSKTKLSTILPKFDSFPPKISNKALVAVGDKWKCPFCPVTHKNRRELKQGHVAKHFSPRYKCGDCNGSWHISSMYRQHHLWNCRFCEHKPFQIGALRRHIKKIHPDKVTAVDPIKGYIKTETTPMNITVNWRGRGVKLNTVATI